MKRKFPISPMDQVMQCLEIHMRLIDLFLSLADVASLGKAFPMLTIPKSKAVPSWDKICEKICQAVSLQDDDVTSFQWGIWDDFVVIGSELQFSAEHDETDLVVMLTPHTFKCYFTYQGDPEDEYSEYEEDEEDLQDTIGPAKHDLMKRLRYNTNVLAVFHSFLSDLTRRILRKCEKEGVKITDDTVHDLHFLGYAQSNNSWSAYG